MWRQRCLSMRWWRRRRDATHLGVRQAKRAAVELLHGLLAEALLDGAEPHGPPLVVRHVLGSHGGGILGVPVTGTTHGRGAGGRVTSRLAEGGVLRGADRVSPTRRAQQIGVALFFRLFSKVWGCGRADRRRRTNLETAESTGRIHRAV
jgi:hypothetical protein